MKNQTATKLDALQSEVDTLKHLRAETTGCEKAEIMKAETLKWEPTILPSSLGFDPTGDRAFKGEL